MTKSSSTMGKDVAATEDEIRSAIGRRIAERRRKLGLSARHVAEELNISREAVTHIETGRNNINAVAIWKLATLFNCALEDFFPEVPDGHALTRVDTRKIKQEGGEQAAQWARKLFGESRKKK